MTFLVSLIVCLCFRRVCPVVTDVSVSSLGWCAGSQSLSFLRKASRKNAYGEFARRRAAVVKKKHTSDRL